MITFTFIRIWGLTTDKTALSAHLAVEAGCDAQQVLQDATVEIKTMYDLYEVTLQVEEFHENMDSCGQCREPCG